MASSGIPRLRNASWSSSGRSGPSVGSSECAAPSTRAAVSSCMCRVSRRDTRLSATSVPPDGNIGSRLTGIGLAKQPLGLEEHNPVAARLENARLPQFPQRSNDDLAHGADGIGKLLLADRGHELRASLALGRK